MITKGHLGRQDRIQRCLLLMPSPPSILSLELRQGNAAALRLPPAPRAATSHGVAAPPPGLRSSPKRPPPPLLPLPAPPRLRGRGSARSPPLHRRLHQLAGAAILGTGDPLSQPQRCLVMCTDVFLVAPVGVGASSVDLWFSCAARCLDAATTFC